MGKKRMIRIEYEYPDECHACPIGEYIQSSFNSPCEFCKSKN